MANPDSFINEVAEEVRRDRVFGMVRRYGWIGVVLVLAIVGGAGWREYETAQRTAAAQALGDALLSASELPTPEARAQAFLAVDAAPDGRALAVLLRAADLGSSPDAPEALRVSLITDLEGLAADQAVSEPLRDLAMVRRMLLDPAIPDAKGGLSDADRRLRLEALATPGRTFRLLAEEHLAVLDIAAGDVAAADARLVRIIADAETPQAQRQRLSDLRRALGTAPDPALPASASTDPAQ